MNPIYTFTSEMMNTKNNIKVFTMYSHFRRIKGNTQKLNESVTEMEAGLRKTIQNN